MVGITVSDISQRGKAILYSRTAGNNHIKQRILVGDGGLEPPTSTMSTWRSTPELIARKNSATSCEGRHKILKPLEVRKALGRLFSGPSAGLAIRYPEAVRADTLNLVSQPSCLLKFQVASMLQHAFFELGGTLN